MNGVDLQARTRRFALDIIRLVEALPRGRVNDVLGRQVLRSGTSVGANYRAACRARSQSDFIAKMKIVEEEADETAYWLRLLLDAGMIQQGSVNALLNEAEQLVAITVASIKTARSRSK